MKTLAAALLAAADALPETEASMHDELVPVSKTGLEKKAVMALVRNGELPSRRIGRTLYVLRSDLVKLIRNAPPKPVVTATISPRDYLHQIAGGKR